ncbi:MAG: hypothetical protein AB7K52_11060 [Phycisphaerales bacterium]
MQPLLSPNPQEVHPDGERFERAVLEIAHAARVAFARIIEFRCPTSRAVTNLCEAFGVHRKLAWQVGKVAYSESLFVAARHIPVGKSGRVWLKAAAGAGVPEVLVGAGADAMARWEQLVNAHTRSRAELEMLLESLLGREAISSDASASSRERAGGAAREGEVEAHRRWRELAFRGNSFVWGAHCRVLLALMVLLPSEEVDGSFHCAQVRGLVGYRQTRTGVRWIVNHGVVADGQKVETSVQRVPLDPEGARAHAGVPVLPAHCSVPMPGLFRRVVGSAVLDEFESALVGQRGERTLVTGEVIRNLGSIYATPSSTFAHFGTGVRIPAEALHLDIFVHASLFGGTATPRELRVFSDMNVASAFDDQDALRVPERISVLGRGVTPAQSPSIPAYTDLMHDVFRLLGARGDEFDLFRVQMAFPPMSVSVMMRHRLPPDPHSTTNPPAATIAEPATD